MKISVRKLIAVAAASLMAGSLAFTAPAFAGGKGGGGGGAGCNAGRGNAGEPPFVGGNAGDCDPGQSGDVNQGGDTVSP